MYAVIRTGGKQYKVAENDVIAVERLDGDAGGELTFSEVLALHDGNAAKIGAPLIDGAQVIADVLEQRKGAKIIIFKKKRRQNYRRKNGHRQLETVVRITAILDAGQPRPAAKPKAEPKSEASPEATSAAKKTPAKKAAPKKAPAKKAPMTKAAAKKAAPKKAPAKKAAAKKSAKKE
jgi:large subunit ribosomal protein L21